MTGVLGISVYPFPMARTGIIGMPLFGKIILRRCNSREGEYQRLVFVFILTRCFRFTSCTTLSIMIAKLKYTTKNIKDEYQKRDLGRAIFHKRSEQDTYKLRATRKLGYKDF